MRISESFRNRLDLAYHIPDYLSQSKPPVELVVQNEDKHLA